MSGNGRVPVDSGAVWPVDVEDERGVLLEWYAGPGDQVEEGEIVCAFQVEKVDIDVPAPTTGELAERTVAVDEEFDRGATLGYVAPE